MITAISLGLRLGRGLGRRALTRSISTVLCTALAVLVLLGVFAAWRLSDIGQHRAVARAPHFAKDGGLAYLGVSDQWKGKSLERTLVAVVGPDAPIPPGLTHIPRPGEVALSPRLASSLAAGDPGLRARFGDDAVTVIARAGLTDRNEMVAYVGQSTNALVGAPRVDRFDNPAQAGDSTGGLRAASALMLVAFVVLPFTAVCAAATRLAAARRRSRLMAMRVLGVASRSLRVVSAIEAAGPVAIGAGLGYVAFLAARPLLGDLTIGAVQPFTADVWVPPVAALAIVCFAVLLAVGSGFAFSSRLDIRGVRPSHVVRMLRWPVLLPGLLGLFGTVVLLLVAGSPTARGSTSFGNFLDATAVLMVGGAALAMPFLVQRVSAWHAPRTRRPTMTIAARRLESDPGSLSRIAGVTVAGFFVVALALALNTGFQLSNAHAGTESTMGGRLVGQIGSALTGRSLHLTGVPAAALVPQTFGRDSAGHNEFPIAIVDCDTLKRLTSELSSCPAMPFVITQVDPSVTVQVPTSPVPEGNNVIVPGGNGRSVSIPWPTSRVRISLPGEASLDNTLVLAPDDPRIAALGPLPVGQATFALPVRSSTQQKEQFRAEVIQLNPTAQVTFAGDSEAASNRSYQSYGDTIIAAALLGMLIGLAGVVMTLVDAVSSRARQVVSLVMVGVPARAIAQGIVAEALVPQFFAVLTGLGAAAMVGAAYGRYRGAGHVPIGEFGVVAGVAAVLLIALGALCAWAVRWTCKLDALRTE